MCAKQSQRGFQSPGWVRRVSAWEGRGRWKQMSYAEEQSVKYRHTLRWMQARLLAVGEESYKYGKGGNQNELCGLDGTEGTTVNSLISTDWYTITTGVNVLWTRMWMHTCMHVCVHMYFLAWPTERVRKQQHPTSSGPIWHSNLGLQTPISTKRNQDSWEKWLIPGAKKSTRRACNILLWPRARNCSKNDGNT